MEYFKWDDSMSVKIKEIDEQHKKLILMINEFYTQITNDGVRDKLEKLLDDLADYTVFHFSTEEKYMEQFNFPEMKSHEKEHVEFVDKIVDVKKRFDDGGLVLSVEVTNFIKDWLVNHIMVTDKKYVKCFMENGLK